MVENVQKTGAVMDRPDVPALDGELSKRGLNGKDDAHTLHGHGALVGPWPRGSSHPMQDWYSFGAWVTAGPAAWGRRVTSPVGVLVIAALLILGVGGYGIGAATAGGPNASTAGSSSSANSSGMNMGGSTTTGQNSTSSASSAPAATQQYTGQPLTYTIDPDGAKHFTLSAAQVMWQPVKGHPFLAWTFNGTVPGPMIRVTAGDHVRIDVINHLPEATTVHWHGLMIPANEDGVPGVGQDPIKPGATFRYDFTVHDQDIGTHFYHSHYDDLTQVNGGLYGAFIVDPRPGSPQAQAMPKADVEYTEIIGEFNGYYMLNGKSFPDTTAINVQHGQNVLIRLINMGQMIHPMHLHGHNFTVVAQDGQLVPQPYGKDTIAIAPGESYDLVFNAWAALGSVYPFHCHILSHVMNPGQTGDEMGGLIALVEYAK